MSSSNSNDEHEAVAKQIKEIIFCVKNSSLSKDALTSKCRLFRNKTQVGYTVLLRMLVKEGHSSFVSDLDPGFLKGYLKKSATFNSESDHEANKSPTKPGSTSAFVTASRATTSTCNDGMVGNPRISAFQPPISTVTTPPTKSSTQTTHSGFHRKPPSDQKRQRFARTANLLNKSGLLGATLKMAELLKTNKQLERDIGDLKRETDAFVQEVLANPENARMRRSLQLQDPGGGGQVDPEPADPNVGFDLDDFANFIGEPMLNFDLAAMTSGGGFDPGDPTPTANLTPNADTVVNTSRVATTSKRTREKEDGILPPNKSRKKS